MLKRNRTTWKVSFIVNILIVSLVAQAFQSIFQHTSHAHLQTRMLRDMLHNQGVKKGVIRAGKQPFPNWVYQSILPNEFMLTKNLFFSFLIMPSFSSYHCQEMIGVLWNFYHCILEATQRKSFWGYYLYINYISRRRDLPTF